MRFRIRVKVLGQRQRHRVGQDKTRQAKPRQKKTKQDKTRQDKTKQVRTTTSQDKTDAKQSLCAVFSTLLSFRSVSRTQHNKQPGAVLALFIYHMFCFVCFVLLFTIRTLTNTSLDTQTKGGVLQVLCCRLKAKPRAKFVTNLYGTIT